MVSKSNSGDIFSIWYKGSLSLILAVTSEGDYFGPTKSNLLLQISTKNFLITSKNGWKRKKKVDSGILF